VAPRDGRIRMTENPGRDFWVNAVEENRAACNYPTGTPWRNPANPPTNSQQHPRASNCLRGIRWLPKPHDRNSRTPAPQELPPSWARGGRWTSPCHRTKRASLENKADTISGIAVPATGVAALGADLGGDALSAVAAMSKAHPVAAKATAKVLAGGFLGHDLGHTARGALIGALLSGI
jgi:hypothetical protein